MAVLPSEFVVFSSDDLYLLGVAHATCRKLQEHRFVQGWLEEHQRMEVNQIATFQLWLHQIPILEEALARIAGSERLCRRLFHIRKRLTLEMTRIGNTEP